MKEEILINKERGKIFPINPFPDVEPQDFNKLNKKKVTEDFVSENFKIMGWNVYEPFTDTGIDRIISKKVCPQGHTLVNETENEKCKKCGAHSVNIVRFVQIKTRALKNGIFGFTLKSKDMRIDPRHIYVLYCDTTQDFLILSVYDYLKFFDDINSNPFAPTSFRKGNQKLNTLRYNKEEDKWSWAGDSWEQYRNIEGLKRIQDTKFDRDLSKWIREARELNNKLIIQFNSGGTYPKEIEPIINKQLQSKLREYSKKENIKKTREAVLNHLRKTIKEKSIFDSVMKYWENIKNLEITGEETEKED